MKLWFFFLFFLSSSFATVCVPFSIDLEQGFRQDHLKIKAFFIGDDLQKQTYKNVRFYQNFVTFRTVQRDIYLLVKGGYAFFGKGKAFFEPENLSFTSTPTPFVLQTKGESYDLKGVFGYSVNLTPERYYKVVLTPLVGYQALWEKLKRSQTLPDPFEGDLGGGAFFQRSFSASSKNLWTKWMGPFIGVNFWIDPGGPFSMRMDYAFHFIQLKQATFQRENIFQFDTSGVLTNFQTITFNSHTKKKGAHGHSGAFELIYLFSSKWNFSLGGNIFYFSSHVQGVGIKKEERGVIPSAPTLVQILQSRYKCNHLMLAAVFSVTRMF